MAKRVLIFSGGPVADLGFLAAKCDELKPFVLICADGGGRYAYELGLAPQALVGDMDSLSPEIQRCFEEEGTHIERHPKDKDKTDTELALEYAFALAPDEIIILAAMGGRLDHTLANVSLLATGVKKKISVRLIDEWCEVFMVERKAVVEGKAGQTVSIFPFSDEASGVSLEGFAYLLTDGVMAREKPYGISNRLKEPHGVISVKKGSLLVIRYFKNGEFPYGK